MTTCGVLGQDPKPEDRNAVKQKVKEAIKGMKEQNVYRYQIGGTGVFTEIVMEVLTEEKEKDPFIRVTQVLPCPESTFGFETSPLCEKSERIDKNADELIFLSPTYQEDCFFMRDLRIISVSKYLLCYFPLPDERTEYINDKEKNIVFI